MFDEGRTLLLESPTLEIKQLSDIIYAEKYEENIYDFILKEDLRPLLLKAGLVGQFHDKDVERINKKIEKIKIQLFLEIWDRTKTKRNRRALANAKKAQTDLFNKASSFDHLTLEHYCSTEAIKFQITKTLRDQKTKELILAEDCSKQEFEKYLAQINEHVLFLPTIRQIARSEYWKGYFLTHEQGVFGKPVGDLNPEQLSLITSTRMYARIAEHPDSPDQSIIDDDDVLDGWVLYQTEKAIEERKKDGKSKNDKIGNSQEVFYMAQNEDQRDDILALNTNASAQIQKNRMNQVMNAQGAAVDSADFGDVRQTLNEAVANKQKKV